MELVTVGKLAPSLTEYKYFPCRVLSNRKARRRRRKNLLRWFFLLLLLSFPSFFFLSFSRPSTSTTPGRLYLRCCTGRQPTRYTEKGKKKKKMPSGQSFSLFFFFSLVVLSSVYLSILHFYRERGDS